ncbi:MAG: NlpC/P60 family protein [Firmicutes bacterium]|jgi:cell wall-associated NlpC family hydrolase|nr:NlpC/P60 family protein [Bacillota bacterium]
MGQRLLVLTLAFAVLLAGSSRAAAGSCGGVLLREGSRGPSVTALQQALREWGYYRWEPDGLFGPATRAAVIAFQRSAGLTADGIVGPRTLEALRAPGSSARSSNSTDAASRLIEIARRFLGTRYKWGGTTPGGFDCSGFVYYVLNACGIEAPRALDAQFAIGLPVRRNEIRAGDLVFFSTYKSGPSHVGIYLGDGTFIHASSARKSVTVTPIDKPFYVKNWVGARRVA